MEMMGATPPFQVEAEGEKKPTVAKPRYHVRREKTVDILELGDYEEVEDGAM